MQQIVDLHSPGDFESSSVEQDRVVTDQALDGVIAARMRNVDRIGSGDQDVVVGSGKPARAPILRITPVAAIRIDPMNGNDDSKVADVVSVQVLAPTVGEFPTGHDPVVARRQIRTEAEGRNRLAVLQRASAIQPFRIVHRPQHAIRSGRE